jgi:hypothetical protein
MAARVVLGAFAAAASVAFLWSGAEYALSVKTPPGGSSSGVPDEKNPSRWPFAGPGGYWRPRDRDPATGERVDSELWFFVPSEAAMFVLLHKTTRTSFSHSDEPTFSDEFFSADPEEDIHTTYNRVPVSPRTLIALGVQLCTGDYFVYVWPEYLEFRCFKASGVISADPSKLHELTEGVMFKFMFSRASLQQAP